MADEEPRIEGAASWPVFSTPVTPPYPPMEAESVGALPADEGWQYEPKWDGFRCVAFKDGDVVALQSKAGQPLQRYFPEVVDAVRKLAVARIVLDGELVVPAGRGFDFDALLQRVHPAESRVRKLARETPAHLLVFDLLAVGDEDLTGLPLAGRRARLEAAFRDARPPASIQLSPATLDVEEAERWLAHLGAEAADGVVAKRLALAYRSGERDGMVKVKRLRTADCVVGGFRWAASGGAVGSLLLGLYGDDGLLHHVGFCSALTAADRRALTDLLVPLRGGTGFTGKAPGGPSRWSRGRDTSWEAVRPEVVVEVRYDHVTGGRFRHGTKLMRLRPDKAAEQCGMGQLRQA